MAQSIEPNIVDLEQENFNSQIDKALKEYISSNKKLGKS